MLKREFTRERRIWWSVVPKAAERSNKRRTEMLPLSRAERISFTIHVFFVPPSPTPPPPPTSSPLLSSKCPSCIPLSTRAHARVCVCVGGGGVSWWWWWWWEVCGHVCMSVYQISKMMSIIIFTLLFHRNRAKIPQF